VASQLDVMIVTNGSVSAAPASVPLDPAFGGFDVRYSVGVADGNGVRWTLNAADNAQDALRVASQGSSAPSVSAPTPRDGADPVLVLLVDGTSSVFSHDLPDVNGVPGETQRWARVAHAATGPETPTFALLQTTQPERLARWQHLTHRGGVVSIQALASGAVTDAAVRLAVAAPTSQTDFALALKHRPVLLFDNAEPVPRPLSVDWLFADRRVQLCQDRGVPETNCKAIARAAELENGGTHLQLRLPQSQELRRLARQDMKRTQPQGAEPGPSGPGAPPAGTPLSSTSPSSQPQAPGTAIYVHPVSVELAGQSLLYLDYWWYLPDNPSGVGGGAFCGAGLVIPGITCDNHESDWEGLTVVIDRTGATPVVTAVQYAQHAAVVRYAWTLLRHRWDTDPELSRFVSSVPDASDRPLAFIAKGTHATYPLPCQESCHQVAHPDLGEGPHRGALMWIGNDTATCGKTGCLQMLPTREGGEFPALWNAFAGTWGNVHCALTYYCDSGSPPPAPGRQSRYLHPMRCSGTVDTSWRFASGGCG
jgi:hypothetical protein